MSPHLLSQGMQGEKLPCCQKCALLKSLPLVDANALSNIWVLGVYLLCCCHQPVVVPSRGYFHARIPNDLDSTHFMLATLSVKPFFVC